VACAFVKQFCPTPHGRNISRKPVKQRSMGLGNDDVVTARLRLKFGAKRTRQKGALVLRHEHGGFELAILSLGSSHFLRKVMF